MAIKLTKEELRMERANRAAKNLLRIVALQLKSTIPLMEARLDADTAEDIANTLRSAGETCMAVSRRVAEYAAVRSGKKAAGRPQAVGDVT